MANLSDLRIQLSTPAGPGATAWGSSTGLLNWSSAVPTGGSVPSAVTTLTALMSISDTVITVGSTTGYPSQGYLLLGSEAVRYTGTTATTFTGVTRPYFSTTAASHAIGTQAILYNFMSLPYTGDTSGQGVFVTSQGRMGIGRSSPASSLSVGGGIQCGGGGGAPSGVGLGVQGITGMVTCRFVVRADTTADAFQVASSASSTGDQFVVAYDGKVGINSATPSCKLDINSDVLRLRTAKTPASAAATGNQGDICWDTNYIYICTATNTWKRAAIATW